MVIKVFALEDRLVEVTKNILSTELQHCSLGGSEWRSIVAVLMLAISVFVNPESVLARSPFKLLSLPASVLTRRGESCPRELEPMVDQMLMELPAYINRENIRANKRKTYVLLASAADFSDDLPLFSSIPSQGKGVKQVFFTTLFRRYVGSEIIYHQEHHRLFLAESQRGWEFVQMYSILDSYPSQNAPAPARNSSGGSVAQALKNWLNNCRVSQQRGIL